MCPGVKALSRHRVCRGAAAVFGDGGAAESLTPQLVEWASRCTVLKASFTMLSGSILVILLIANTRHLQNARTSG
jgi:hypothetical protein